MPSNYEKEEEDDRNRTRTNGTRNRLLTVLVLVSILVFKDLFVRYEGFLPANGDVSFVRKPSLQPANEAKEELETTTAPTEALTTAAPTSLCQLVQTHSPMALWTRHLNDIFAASQMKLDRNFALHDMTAHVLQLVTPRLPLGQRSLPRQEEALLTRILEKLQRRWDFVKADKETSATTTSAPEQPDIPPKLRIVVLGGSVTMGVNCYTGIRKYDYGNCAWSARLEHLINTLAGGAELVEVINLSVGGSNTATGTTLMEFDLVPEHARNPDIVINAYSTNDMHILTMKDAESSNLTLKEKTFDMAQTFARTILGMCPQKRPLLLWLDDYLGNEQRGILQTTELSQGIQVLANYYGFGFVSYADTVRDWVYASTNETAFSPAGWYNGKMPGMSREIHPGASTHLAITYVIAYYMLQLASVSCNIPTSWASDTDHGKYLGGFGLPDKFRDNKGLATPPRPKRAMPPQLNPTLELDHVSLEWEKAAAVQKQNHATKCSQNLSNSSDDNDRQCPFSWVSGFSEATKPDEIMSLLGPYIVPPTGWELRDDRKVREAAKKYGFSPNVTAVGGTMTMEFSFQKDISTLAVFFLKSYGEKWENSTCTITVVSPTNNATVARHQIQGFHDKKTSENYSEKILFTKPLRNLRVRFEHSSGQTFKLMGLAVCS